MIRKYPSHGFSLLELLTTIVVVGLLLTVSVPLMGGALSKAKTRTAKREFVSAHSLARAAALRSRRTAELHIDAASGAFWIEIDTSRARTGAMDTLGMVRRIGRRGVRMTSNRSLVCFDHRGLATTRDKCEDGALTVTFRGSQVGLDSVITSSVGMTLR